MPFFFFLIFISNLVFCTKHFIHTYVVHIFLMQNTTRHTLVLQRTFYYSLLSFTLLFSCDFPRYRICSYFLFESQSQANKNDVTLNWILNHNFHVICSLLFFCLRFFCCDKWQSHTKEHSIHDIETKIIFFFLMPLDAQMHATVSNCLRMYIFFGFLFFFPFIRSFVRFFSTSQDAQKCSNSCQSNMEVEIQKNESKINER